MYDTLTYESRCNINKGGEGLPFFSERVTRKIVSSI